MKPFLFLLLLTGFFSCAENNNTGNMPPPKKQIATTAPEPKTSAAVTNKAPVVNYWQQDWHFTLDPDKDSIWFRPVRYYLDNKECAAIARDFYEGRLRPSDDSLTTALMELAAKGNDSLRPFYRWCLHQVLLISDGALGELTGVPARQYAEKFPDEFFHWLDKEAGKGAWQVWTEAIAYSGFYDFKEYDDYPGNRKKLERTMLQQSRNKTAAQQKRIRKFAADCTTL
jgi:hypothetical protein